MWEQNRLIVRRWSLLFFCIVFVCSFVRYAWITEDAFINFRVIENVRDGYGLVWNPGERVQVFTSPLWMLLTLTASLVTGEELYTSIVISFVAVSATFYLLYLVAGRSAALFLFAAFFMYTRTVRDYSSSGLEAPLLMLFIGAFIAILCLRGSDKKQLLFLFMAAAGCLLVRHDSLILVLPFLVQQAVTFCKPLSRRKFFSLVRIVIGGLSPFIAWSFFSLLYYGRFFPNTASAKIVGGFDRVEQASYYFEFMQYFDPAVYVVIASTIIVAFILRDRYLLPLLSAIMLWVAYMFLIGGDYMAGRFCIGPLVLCVFLLSDMARRFLLNESFASIRGMMREKILVIFLVIPTVAFGFVNLNGRNSTDFSPSVMINGIVDERSFYYSSTDLMGIIFWGVQHGFKEGADLVNKIKSIESGLIISCNIGMLGYYLEKNLHVIDPYALGDPFLAGFPLRQQKQRVGHFERSVPIDYVLSILNNANEFTNPIARKYYDDVVLISREALFSYDRLKAVTRINTGYYSRKLANIDVSEMGGELRVSQPNTSMSPCLGGKSAPMIVFREKDDQVRLDIL